MSDQEKMLQYKTSLILGKNTSRMTLNEIIEELVNIIEINTIISVNYEMIEEGLYK